MTSRGKVLRIPASPAITRSDLPRDLRMCRSRRPIVRASSMSTKSTTPSPGESPSLMLRDRRPGACASAKR